MTERDHTPNNDLTDADIVDELTDDEEAILAYHAVRGEKKDKKRAGGAALPTAVPGAAGSGAAGAMPPAGAVGGAAVGAPAAVSFGQAQLHAGGAMAADDDPWGAADDEYAVPGAVTGADDERDEKKRGGSGPMALRGSGTRGGSGPQAGAGGTPMMPPGATLGGVGGPQTASVSAAAMQQTSMTNAAGSQMPLNLLQSAQAAKAVTPQAFAPAAGTVPMGGVAAAGSSTNVLTASPFVDLDGDGIADDSGLPEVTIDGDGRIRATGGSTGAGGAMLVDTDGDGIPDSPADSSSLYDRNSGAPRAAGTGGGGVLLGSGPGTGSTGGSLGTGGSSTGGNWGSLNTSPTGSTVNAPTTSSTWTGSTSTGSTGSTWTPPTTSSTGVSAATSGGGYTSGGSTSGPSTASIPTGAGSTSGSSSSGVNFSQSTAGYAPTSGTDFSVNRADLRREAAQFEDISAEMKPVQQLILSSPDPRLMFGVMVAPVAPYQKAVVTSAETVEETGDATMTISFNLGDSARNYEETEEANIDGAGRIN